MVKTWEDGRVVSYLHGAKLYVLRCEFDLLERIPLPTHHSVLFRHISPNDFKELENGRLSGLSEDYRVFAFLQLAHSLRLRRTLEPCIFSARTVLAFIERFVAKHSLSHYLLHIKGSQLFSKNPPLPHDHQCFTIPNIHFM